MDVSKYSAYDDYKWAVGINQVILTLCGIWPKNNETKQEKLLSNIRVILMLNILICGCFIPTIHSLFKIWGDIMCMIDNMQYTLPLFIILIKLSTMWIRKKDILLLLNMIKDDWLKPKKIKERDVMKKRARLARIFTIFGYFMMLVSYILVVVLPIFGISMRYLTNKTDPDKLTPLQSYYIYDKNKSPFFEVSYIMQSLGLMVAGVTYSSVDSFFGLLVFHVCGQLENLKMRIIHLDKFKNFEIALSHSVQDHIRLIRFINMIDDIFTLMLLSVLLYFGIVFACYGFLLGTMVNQGRNLPVPRLILIILASVNSFAHTCLYCAVGEILVTQCEGVYEAACKYKWYNLDPKKTKSLMMIMIRANKPSYLSAGKLFPMTMSTFCNMIKTSGGYISVLLAHRE
ncbi:odorant receptor 49b [Solenopsis invicta]|uniref:odorant receptor 49b n=1 Tax=Solenopsis invicta TaxID=13686 RepID=UPI00193DDE1C|nr:odorant receptor 49b [Solenopsis invicta]